MPSRKRKAAQQGAFRFQRFQHLLREGTTTSVSDLPARTSLFGPILTVPSRPRAIPKLCRSPMAPALTGYLYATIHHCVCMPCRCADLHDAEGRGLPRQRRQAFREAVPDSSGGEQAFVPAKSQTCDDQEEAGAWRSAGRTSDQAREGLGLGRSLRFQQKLRSSIEAEGSCGIGASGPTKARSDKSAGNYAAPR